MSRSETPTPKPNEDTPPKPKGLRRFLGALGPGLTTGAADVKEIVNLGDSSPTCLSTSRDHDAALPRRQHK